MIGRDVVPEEDLLVWQKEAAFARSVLDIYFSNTNQSMQALEVGSGTGLLLQKLSCDFPQHKFVGLEPFGAGFGSLEELQVSSAAPILPISYSDYAPDQKFDIIFSVNVFEHLPDWQDFIDTASQWLQPNGKIIVLCPNYGFPYESHFGIPIIVNKSVTARLFAKYIERVESEMNTAGLWSSLNFVRKSEVDVFCRRRGLSFYDRRDILDVMVGRLLSDPIFRKRHVSLFYIARLIKALGVVALLKTRLFKRIVPYMHFEIARP